MKLVNSYDIENSCFQERNPAGVYRETLNVFIQSGTKLSGIASYTCPHILTHHCTLHVHMTSLPEVRVGGHGYSGLLICLSVRL